MCHWRAPQPATATNPREGRWGGRGQLEICHLSGGRHPPIPEWWRRYRLDDRNGQNGNDKKGVWGVLCTVSGILSRHQYVAPKSRTLTTNLICDFGPLRISSQTQSQQGQTNSWLQQAMHCDIWKKWLGQTTPFLTTLHMHTTKKELFSKLWVKIFCRIYFWKFS